jgi:hypothetical protein
MALVDQQIMSNVDSRNRSFLPRVSKKLKFSTACISETKAIHHMYIGNMCFLPRINHTQIVKTDSADGRTGQWKWMEYVCAPWPLHEVALSIFKISLFYEKLWDQINKPHQRYLQWPYISFLTMSAPKEQLHRSVAVCRKRPIWSVMYKQPTIRTAMFCNVFYLQLFINCFGHLFSHLQCEVTTAFLQNTSTQNTSIHGAGTRYFSIDNIDVIHFCSCESGKFECCAAYGKWRNCR